MDRTKAASYEGSFKVRRPMSGREQWQPGDTRSDRVGDVAHLVESGALVPEDKATAEAVSAYFGQDVKVGEYPKAVQGTDALAIRGDHRLIDEEGARTLVEEAPRRDDSRPSGNAPAPKRAPAKPAATKSEAAPTRTAAAKRKAAQGNANKAEAPAADKRESGSETKSEG